MFRISHTHAAGLLAVGLIGLGTSAGAATIVAGNVTNNLGPDFFFDDAATGGNDHDNANAFFFRDFGTLNVGSAGTHVSITGIGFASRGYGTATPPSGATVTITYLGLDGASGGGDDVVLGSATDNLIIGTTGSEYYWAFDSPIAGTIDGLNSIFRINITSADAHFRYKTTSGSLASAVKLSVAGTSTAVPEPSSLALIGLGALACMRRRRGQ